MLSADRVDLGSFYFINFPILLPLTDQIRRVLQAMVDPTTLDDKDYYGNKRLELWGGGALLIRAYGHSTVAQ